MRVILFLLASFCILLLLTSQCNAVMYSSYATPHRAPWLAFVWGKVRDNPRVTSRTSGILVHPRYVIISVRRCNDLYSFRVSMSYSEVTGNEHEGIAVNKQWYNEKYKWNNNLYSHSTCLLRMERNIRLSRTIQVAVLAGPGDPWPSKHDAKFIVAGWGKHWASYTDKDAWGKKMTHMESQVYNTKGCTEYYGARYIKDDVFCIGYNTRMTKTGKGDEGAPFVDTRTGRVYGMVVNFEENETQERKMWPTLANNLGWSRDWIFEKIREDQQSLRGRKDTE